MRKCRECGAANSDTARWCARCGAPTKDPHKAPAVILSAVTLAAGCLFAAVFIGNLGGGTHKGGFSSGGGGGGGGTSVAVSRTETPAVHTEAPTAEPPAVQTERAAADIVESVPSDPYYSVYENDIFGLSCIYPMHFVPYDDPEAVYAVMSPEGTARQRICVSPTGGAVPETEAERYIALHPGTLDTRNVGDDYYVVAVDDGETCYYKYCKFANGCMYSFEFINPSFQDGIYSGYVSAIYDEFTVR